MFLLLSGLLVGCGERMDHRHKYVGDFDVSGTYYNAAMGGPGDTLSVVSNAEVDFGTDEQNIVLDLKDWSVVMEFKLGKHGELLHIDNGGTLGEFSDRHHFHIHSSGISPLGDEIDWNLQGIRQ